LKTIDANDQPCFCVFGVACDLYQEEVGDLEVQTWVDEQDQRFLGFDRRFGSLPDKVVSWLGMKNQVGLFTQMIIAPMSGMAVNVELSLLDLNDAYEFDLPAIAKAIEMHEDEIFVEGA
jgi:hypothetical protein